MELLRERLSATAAAAAASAGAVPFIAAFVERPEGRGWRALPSGKSTDVISKLVGGETEMGLSCSDSATPASSAVAGSAVATGGKEEEPEMVREDVGEAAMGLRESERLPGRLTGGLSNESQGGRGDWWAETAADEVGRGGGGGGG